MIEHRKPCARCGRTHAGRWRPPSGGYHPWVDPDRPAPAPGRPPATPATPAGRRSRGDT